MFLLISIEDADEILPDEWQELDDEVKLLHIQQASLYVRARWVCIGIDWDSSPSISDTLIYGIARYAYHDFKGELYPVESARIKRVKKKAGAVEKEVEYTNGQSGQALSYLNDIFSKECARIGSSSSHLVRV